jgi:hypothetical protein
MVLHTVLILKEFVRVVQCVSSITVPCTRCKCAVVETLRGIDMSTKREFTYRPNQVMSQFPHTTALVGKQCNTCTEYHVPLQTKRKH